MALWLVRAGKRGEHEAKFLEESRIYVCWGGLDVDLGRCKDRKALESIITEFYPDRDKYWTQNASSQIWVPVGRMQIGDWVAVPSRFAQTIHFAEVTGGYTYHPGGPDPYFHSRSVKWIAQDVSKYEFDQDILHSLGAFMTFCKIERNDAEKRVRAVATNGWRRVGGTQTTEPSTEAMEEDERRDLEAEGRERIASLIERRYKGHGLTDLVAAILVCKGYTVHQSPPGPDKGVDILAAPGSLGFGSPRLCVQVKSGNTPADHMTFTHLVGAMSNFNADQGLLVSWSGVNQAVERERAARFFNVRFWDRDDLIAEILENYDQLDPDLRAELPLKRVWTVASAE